MRAKQGAHHDRRADVDWSGVGLTFFRDFPNLTLRLDGLTVAGSDAFAQDTLVSMGSFRIAASAGSLIRGMMRNGPFVVRSMRFEEPAVHLRVLEDGTANWDIVRRPEEEATTTQPPPRPMRIELSSLQVTDGSLSLDNAQALSANVRETRSV